MPSRIYVGNLPSDVKERDVEDIFSKYGKIRFCDVKGGRGPLYAFLEFEDERDAEDAVRGRDGYEFDGKRIRVEFTRGVPRDSRDGGSRGGRDYGRGGDRGGPRFERGGGRFADRISNSRNGSRRTGYRVTVSGLPPTGSWQDLKDHMREAGEVCFTDVFKDGTGVVEFSRSEGLRNAIKKLDDTKFKSHEGETSYIVVREDTESNGRRSRSRSRSPIERRSSPQYSPRRSKSRSESRSRSRSRSRS